jgi:hypothetical protein
MFPPFFEKVWRISATVRLRLSVIASTITATPFGDGFAPLKQPQLALRPFDLKRLKEVGMKLRSMYPATDRMRFEATVTPDYLDALVQEVSEGLRADVGVVPRQFLRRLVSVFDIVEQEPDFRPAPGKPPIEPALTHTEASLRAGRPEYEPEPGDDKGYEIVNF